MTDCGCGGSGGPKRAARSAAARQATNQPANVEKREGGPQDRGSGYYSRAGQYTGPAAPSK